MSTSSTRNPNLEALLPSTPPRTGSKDLVGPRPSTWWTGLHPDGVLRSLPLLNLATATRQDWLDYLANSWALTEVLFSSLQGDEAFYRAPYHRLRHPMIFYYAHPAALYVNKLRLAGLLSGPVNAYFERLFETGVDEMSWDDLSRGELDWPPVHEVTEYRRTVYGLVRNVLATHPALQSGHARVAMDSPLWAVAMAFEHERIHVELSSVLIRELPLHLVLRPAQWPPNHPSAGAPSSESPAVGRDFPANGLLELPTAPVHIGKPRDFPSYGWDNEYGDRRVDVEAFRASRFLVSNGEFHEFVKSGGYAERRYWTEQGWGWRSFRNAKWPTFWVPEGPAGLHRYRLRLLFEVVPMRWSWPVEVNRYEALAYCAWRTERDGAVPALRVVTEAEHHRLRGQSAMPSRPSEDPVLAPGGPALNLNLRWGSPSPVDAYDPSPEGFHDVSGNVWEWCMDHFHPLPGFRIHPLYDDFSTPCFDGEHFLILGGSFASTGDEASVFARFQFRPHFFQHCGFRIAQSADVEAPLDAVLLDEAKTGKIGGGAHAYETGKMLDEYLLLHYGGARETLTVDGVPEVLLDFPKRCAALVTKAAGAAPRPGRRALDIGCAVGGAAFELARSFDEVIGVDLSESFITAAGTLKEAGELSYFRRDEGELGVRLVARVDPTIDRRRVSFRRADACSLPADLHGFDAVLLANLLCRVPSPKAVLGRLGGPRGLVRPGGVLVLTTPFTWMEEFTLKDVWLGGFYRDGVAQWSKDALRRELDPEFELLEATEVPLIIREHRRKFQLIVSHATVWRRRTEGIQP